MENQNNNSNYRTKNNLSANYIIDKKNNNKNEVYLLIH